ncbi:MAG TPA: 30S ribosomal protein S6 [Phycisphaerae bacterium]|nr:30S ribosomal protein S6 [Phycisphaerae bacterium]
MSQDKQTYEAMFLVDSGSGDFEAASQPAQLALSRNEAEVLSFKPWDERRLAFDIDGRRRGLYILAYFKAPSGRIADLERDCQLDERVLRLLVLRREELSEEEINAETPATAGARRAAARRTDDDDRKDSDDNRDSEDSPRPPRRTPRSEGNDTGKAGDSDES